MSHTPEFIILWTFFQNWVLKNLANLYCENVEVVVKHTAMEVFSALTFSATFVVGIILRISIRL